MKIEYNLHTHFILITQNRVHQKPYYVSNIKSQFQSIPPAKYIQINLAVASSSAAAVLQFY